MPAVTPSASTNAEPTAQPTAVTPSTSVSASVAAPPVSLRIPELEMDVEVSPLAWRVAEVEGKRTTIWVLPTEGAGWHPNSVGAGAAGTMVISGNQLLGDAAFAPIALGEVEVGQEIEITDSNGSVFTYTVVDVTEPLPISASLTQEQGIANLYLTEAGKPVLVLITGWPDFSSTARVIVTAELTASE